MRQKKRRIGSYQDVEDRFGIPSATLYSMVSKKQIPHIRIGPRHIKFDLDELDLWFDSKRVEIKTPGCR